MSTLQHMLALKQANKIRLGAAEIKREIGRGEKTVAEILDPSNPIPEVLGSMTLMTLMMAQHRWGRERARKFVNRVRIGERRRLDSLTARERRLLVCELAAGTSKQAEALAA